MYQVMYEDNIKGLVEQYLRLKANGLSILLHEDIGTNHKRDHTEGARWIGEKLTLNLAIFLNKTKLIFYAIEILSINFK